MRLSGVLRENNQSDEEHANEVECITNPGVRHASPRPIYKQHQFWARGLLVYAVSALLINVLQKDPVVASALLASQALTAEKHLKKCSKSLVTREMQIKPTLRFYLTPTRMTKMKTSKDRTC